MRKAILAATGELIVDGFAGGGGASEGITLALGRGPDLAYNHDTEALAMHRINHPETHHVCTNIMKVDPLAEVGTRPVGLAWFSPDCKHHSKAKGGKPVKRAIRDLAWVVVLWARRARPRVILLENVEEFRDWGPLVERAPGQFHPDPARRGQTFDRWTAELRRLGYRVEWRELRACDYGAPTIRKRLFLIARRDGRPIVWPAPTHGAPDSEGVRAGRLKPWRTAAGIIDWAQPCHSIFLSREEGRAVGVNRPLAENTMARIAKGVKRYVLDAAEPFIVPLTHQGGERGQGLADPLATVTAAHRGEQALVTPFVAHHRTGHVGAAVEAPLCTVTANGFEVRPGGAAPIAVVAPSLVAYYGAGEGGSDRSAPVDEPVRTVVTETLCASGSHQAVVSAGMLSLKGSERGLRDAAEPMNAVLAGGKHAAEVRAFLTKYYGPSVGQDLAEPAHTATAKARFGLVTVSIGGEPYVIADIGMRMLTPRELFRAQGFGDHYVIDRGLDADGNTIALTKTAQIRMCGNSVCPDIAATLVAANYRADEAQAPRHRPAAEPAALPLFAAE